MAQGPKTGIVVRVRRAWRALAPDQRLAAVAAIGLFATMFLPWYSKSAVGVDRRGLPVKAEDSLNAFAAFSFVEAAVLLVAVGVLVLLFARAEDRSFHLPGGDGTVILAGGVWVGLLIFIRQLDKPDADPLRGLATTVGVQWGIFVAFLAGMLMAYAGNRVRAAHHVEPPLPGEDEVDEPEPVVRAARGPLPDPHAAPTGLAAATPAGRRARPAPPDDD